MDRRRTNLTDDVNNKYNYSCRGGFRKPVYLLTGLVVSAVRGIFVFFFHFKNVALENITYAA